VQNSAATGTRDATRLNCSAYFRARRRHQAANFRKRRLRNVPVFWAAPSQGNQLDRASTYHSGCVTPRGIRIEPSRVTLAGGWGRVFPIFYCSAVVRNWPVRDVAPAAAERQPSRVMQTCQRPTRRGIADGKRPRTWLLRSTCHGGHEAWRTQTRRRGSVRLEAGELDHLAPFLGIRGNQLAEIGRRARKCGAAQLG
jgi:hypothetical protein